MLLKFRPVFFFFISLLVLTSAVSMAQPAIYWGPEMDVDKGDDLVEIFGHSDSFFYALIDTRKKRDGYLIEKIDADSLTRLDSKKIRFQEDDKFRPLLEFPMSLKNNSYLIATKEHAEHDTIDILAYRLTEDLKLQDPVILGSSTQANLTNQEGFSAFSNDDKTRLIVIIPKEHADRRNEKFEVRLFDENLNLLNSKNLEVPHSSQNLDYVDAILDENGILYVLASITDESLDNPDGRRNLAKDFSLFKYNWEDEKLTEKSLSLGNRWLYDVRFLINDRQNIQVVGYYSTMVDLVMAGTFSLEINPKNGDIVNQGISPFDRDFRTKFRPTTSRDRQTEMGRFKLDYVFAMPGQGATLISEKSYVETTSIWNPTTNTYQTIIIYNYDEVLATCINPDSKIKYNIVIPKYQSSNSSASVYTSYLAFRRGGSTCIVYNDHFRNEEIPLNSEQGYRQLSSSNNSQVIMAIIDDKGNTKKLVLKDMREEKVNFNSAFMHEAGNYLILVANNPYKTRYFKIKLKSEVSQ
jgi:hypothetical protein